MALTFSAFRTYVLDFMWRQNDSDLSSDFGKIVRMANAELNRTLDLQRREVTVTIAPEQEDYSLPSDFYQMVSLSNLQLDRQSRHGEFHNTTLSHIYEVRTATESTYVEPYYYVQRAAAANTLYLVGPFSASNPGSLALVYRTAIPDYENTDSSWVEEDYLDLYVYAVLKHAGVYLREDERVQYYTGLLAEAVASAVDEDLRKVKFGGSPISMRPHHYVPQTRRR